MVGTEVRWWCVGWPRLKSTNFTPTVKSYLLSIFIKTFKDASARKLLGKNKTIRKMGMVVLKMLLEGGLHYALYEEVQ